MSYFFQLIAKQITSEIVKSLLLICKAEVKILYSKKRTKSRIFN